MIESGHNERKFLIVQKEDNQFVTPRELVLEKFSPNFVDFNVRG